MEGEGEPICIGVIGGRGGDWDGMGDGLCCMCGDIECELSCPFIARIPLREPFAEGVRAGTGTACLWFGLGDIDPFIAPFMGPFIDPFMPPFIEPFIAPFMPPFTAPFKDDPFMPAFMAPFIAPFIAALSIPFIAELGRIGDAQFIWRAGGSFRLIFVPDPSAILNVAPLGSMYPPPGICGFRGPFGCCIAACISWTWFGWLPANAAWISCFWCTLKLEDDCGRYEAPLGNPDGRYPFIEPFMLGIW
jgi:hypothetical protein